MSQRTKNLTAYYRVSTRQQGESGLKLEAQETAVEDHQRQNGGTLIASYTEVETGKPKNRP